MKKQYLAILSTLFVLTACKSQTSTPTESTTQTTVSSTTTSTTKVTTTKEQATTAKTASETKQETTTQEAKKVTVQNNTTPTPASMNIEEIKTGNLSSIKGTWRNDYGQELTFHENGTVSVKDSAFKVQPTQTQYQEGLLNWIFTPLDNQPAVGSAIMTFVPKNQVVTYGLIEGNKDTSDTTKDRLFGTQSALTSDALKKAMYYKISE
ncbi:DUF6287 domain-containing protein [uncultured Granulicatella sp.]|uniref:DUF6287 domain-containing protein n=1 Tax=uncultured Granulicatella sp. TaxID=316089 RepID=UPI0028D27735|nr:DUF6287 domain-containing protein [uncultured Granulicatella sp.]